MNKERLLKLANHLERGKLGHDDFDFTTFHDVDASGKTYGCALGELPFLFPDEWELKLHSPYLQAGEFFDLSENEVNSLFSPKNYFFSNWQRALLPGMKELSEDPTKEEVAANIRSFVAAKESL